ncbi:unnamed protein product [Closterium sp. NIES-53]
MAAQELRWLTYLLTDLGEPPRSPPVLYVDNKAMLALCREQRLEHRTKHIALRYFLARELQQRGQLRLAYVASEANTADVFTKALAPCDHQRCCTQLGLLCFALLDCSSGGGGGGGGGGGSGGGGGGGGGGGSGGASRGSTQRSGSGGGQRQQQQRSPETPSPQQLREWYAGRQRGGGTGPCTYVLRTGDRVEEHDEGDCYLCLPPDPGGEAAALGACEAAALGAGASAAPGTGESALSGTTSAQVFHTFTLDSGASRSFFRDRTTLTPLSRLVAVSLADPSGGPVLASFSTDLPCPAAPSGTLSGLYLPSFSTNLVSGADLQDQGVDQFTPASPRVTHCTCARTGRHLATFTHRPGSSLYTLSTESPSVLASGQVAASSQVFAAASGSGPESAPCSCRLLSHHTLLWHHHLGHPSLPRLRGMASCVLVSGLPRSLPPLPPGPAPTCVPCVEGRQRAAPHSSEIPSVEPSGPYPELVGCLMYLMTCTRPDLAYPLSILARYVAPGRHRPEHMTAAKRVLRYLCSTSGLGLVLGGRRPVVLTGHADASWADDQATQRSSQGYTFSLGSGSVSWRSTRSSSVLGSNCEAEIYAGAMAAQELRWLTYLLADLGEPPRSPPVLYVDNKAMLALCREHRLEHRTKHIALRYFLARELQQRGQLRLAYVASEANTTDIFTKALSPGDHQRFCTMLACFALLDWSCDLLFSPTLPMGVFLLVPNSFASSIIPHLFHTTTISTPYRYTAGSHKEESAPLKPARIRNYQRKLGCLLFAAITCRPDLSYSASQLATYLKRPEAEHMAELDRDLHYLVSTPTIGLIYYKSKTTTPKLIGYVDADHAGDPDNRRSRTGYIYRLESIGPISWQSSKQELIALSSAEA